MVELNGVNISVRKGLEEHLTVVKETFERCYSQITGFIELALSTLKNGGKVAFIGNGGSAADSQHLAAEFVGRFAKERAPLPAIALTTDTSILTALGNDYGFEEIFSRQVDALLGEGDLLVAISTSGNSQNVIKAVLKAKDKGVKVVGLLGKGGGVLKDLCDISIVVPSDSTPRIQETHIFIGHIVCEEVEKALYG
ncbi:MAG: D-sedoheptulose 7-phosphate isomerase [bacterium]|nr:MAG: Phosphoheptose isomerase [bacterium 42_11]MDK2871233.1 D-sedoheptulose 7-phosphate isomerase [bacterium]